MKYYDLMSLETLTPKVVKLRIKNGLKETMGVYMKYKEFETKTTHKEENSK